MLRYFPKLPPWSNPPLQLLIACLFKKRSTELGRQKSGWLVLLELYRSIAEKLTAVQHGQLAVL